MSPAAGSRRSSGARVVTREVELYAPVKAYLEARGYEVKGEVAGCDLVAVRAGEPPIVVELKLAFTLGLVLQGVDRLAISDTVYLAVPGRRRGGAECGPSAGASGSGCSPSTVRGSVSRCSSTPCPTTRRRDRRRAARVLGEHRRRRGDPTPGGSARTPVMTAYRQEALRLAAALGAGPAPVAALRVVAEAPDAQKILARDVYGWFERVKRGTYRLREGVTPMLGQDGSAEA